MCKHILFSLLFLFLFVSLTAQIPTLGMIAHYSFNGNANNVIDNNNNCRVFGATLTRDRFGNPDAAYYFDGINDYIGLESTVGLNNQTFTLSWWAQPDELPLSGESMVMIDLGSTSVPGDIAGQVIAINNNYFNTTGWRTTSGNTDGSAVGFQNDVLPRADDWYHLTLVRSRDSVKFYVNCQLLLQQANRNKVANYYAPNRFYIGSRIALYLDQYFHGKIDDISIYDRALGAREIKALCNDGICRQSVAVTDTLIIGVRTSSYNPVRYANTVKIFPNPARTQLTIDAGNVAEMRGYTYRIINVAGQVVNTGNFMQKQTTIALSGWGQPGVYFFQLTDPRGNIEDIKRIVIQ
jgi:Concanavalin A-like lectin/glucanases superfamily/Secretion system C-terminal sorting domain